MANQPDQIVNTALRRVDLWSYLDAEAIERAETDANAWIKSLRHVPVEGVPLRDRFQFRGDSLWWFAELYLHKRRVVATILRTIFALEALASRGGPHAGLAGEAPGRRTSSGSSRPASDGWRGRRADAPNGSGGPAGVARRQHWSRRRSSAEDGPRPRLRRRPSPVCSLGALEAGDRRRVGIGPVLRGVAAGRGHGLALVGVGTRRTFRPRRWA
jgi:hypothetical protein